MAQIEASEQRTALDAILRQVEGVKKVYYQPPASISLEYPCIIYSLSSYDIKYAANKRTLVWAEYTATLIDKDPESPIHDRMMNLGSEIDSNCFVHFDRFFTADYLNHWTYRITFTKKSW